MKRITLIILITAASFCFGFAFNSILTSQQNKGTTKMKKVTGIGGIFFKCKDPKAINEWYKKHLGFNTSPYGTNFEWRESEDSTKKGLTVWNPFPENTKYFEPSKKEFMINYRVDNLEALVEELKKENVTIVDKIETYDYGKFVHILDIEGNNIELWEPKD
jgi:predicted enzyme related to lactoylglutathione lyase